MIKHITGDLLDEAEKGTVDLIVHQANLEHTFGSGIAKQIRLRFPYAYEADLNTPFCTPTKLGTYSVGVQPDKPIIINMYSQTSLRPVRNTSYDAIFEALTALRDALLNGTHRIIGFPYLMGCGLADGRWSIVETIISEVFKDSPFEIVIVRLPEAK